MKSTEEASLGAHSASSDRFESLRAAYHARLSSDRDRIRELKSRLIGAAPCPPSLYGDIRNAAHRMAGAAAVFNAPEVSTAAGDLEAAALAAAEAPGGAADSRVRAAIEALDGVLTGLIP